MNIGVLGAGTWGSALAVMLSNTGHNVTVWSAIKEETVTLSATRRHKNLPDMIIPEELVFTADICSACKDKGLIVFAVPSVYVRKTAQSAREHIPDGQIIVDVAKGIEPDTLYTMTQVISDVIDKDGSRGIKVVALSGPTHAEEVAVGLPTAIISASPDKNAARFIQRVFGNDNMRVYTNSDIIGVELCGAMKNIIALAAGISKGLGNGDNAGAAIITRGMAEITRLGIAMGCNKNTFYGLAGIGDLIVTATSVHSRNNRAGRLIGEGMSPKDAVAAVGMVVEGINALGAAVKLAEKYDVQMPITTAVNSIINHGADPADTVRELMRREMKQESIY